MIFFKDALLFIGAVSPLFVGFIAWKMSSIFVTKEIYNDKILELKKEVDYINQRSQDFVTECQMNDKIQDKVVDRLDRMEKSFEKSIESIVSSFNDLKKTVDTFMSSEMSLLKNFLVEEENDNNKKIIHKRGLK